MSNNIEESARDRRLRERREARKRIKMGGGSVPENGWRKDADKPPGLAPVMIGIIRGITHV